MSDRSIRMRIILWVSASERVHSVRNARDYGNSCSLVYGVFGVCTHAGISVEILFDPATDDL